MGNLFSSEEKLHRKNSHAGNHSSQTFALCDGYRYNHVSTSVARQREHKYIKRRNLSFQGRNGRNYYYKSKSHSLNAILEELYSFDPEIDIREGRPEVNGSRIPRIKLKRSTSSLNYKEEKNYKALRKMSSETEIFFEDTTNLREKVNNDVNGNISQSTTKILINGRSYDEISKKSDDNYFAKNFDDCMRCLEIIEKEYELIEKVDTDKHFCKFTLDSNGAEKLEGCRAEKTECKAFGESEFENSDCKPNEKFCGDHEKKFENQTQILGKSENLSFDAENNSINNASTTTPLIQEKETQSEENQEPISDWYSSLKQQFEKQEQENLERKAREMSCRITGATLKTQNERCKSEDKEKQTRHYFSDLVKSNRSLIDEELPDPDKVKHIRAMFQETLNSTLKRKLDKKLGGSLQNISFRAAEQQMMRPLSAQCCRDELINVTRINQRAEDKKEMEISSKNASTPSRDETKDFEMEKTKKKLFEKYERDSKNGREFKSRRVLQPRWTDTGSVSSGVGSDLSSYDTDLESYSREGTEQDEITISDDDLIEEVKDKHYIQNEVLEKIRSYGTSVTYYGGEMITCSVGPLLSPTTQAIMEEIGEKYGHENHPIRSFDEFYRKYVETNEHSKKKKIGRTRSFGQNDVFQRPNVLNNTEIELYKNDLEIEIGIKKPLGFSQNSLKRKVTKSASLESETKATEKARESREAQVAVPTPELQNPIDSAEGKVMEKGFLEKEIEIESDNLIENVNSILNSNSEPNPDEKIKNVSKTVEENQENKETKECKEIIKVTPEKKYDRSKSAPEGTYTPKKQETTQNGFECPAKEIYFSYEKSIFNGKRNSDMEFEEFEVCESLSEKLEKLEKLEKQSSEGSEPSRPNAETDSQESFEENTKGELNETLKSAPTEENEMEKMETDESSLPSLMKMENDSYKVKETKYNHSRWPIETTVMVDIQKNDEQTPKIVTNRKTLAKTKVRLF